jgi:hypothetical protein
MDPPGYETGSSKRRRSGDVFKGRGQPPTQQGMVVGTVTFPRTEFANRKQSMPPVNMKALKDARPANNAKAFQQLHRVHAPLGDPLSFQAMQGEVAIAALDDYGVAERNILSLDSQLTVTTTVNGWPVGKEACFAGIVRNARPITGDGQGQDDQAGTVAHCGVQGTPNTGPNEICPGDMVYFSLTPHAEYKPDGTVVNQATSDEPGEPGSGGDANEEGVVASKFRVALYPLRDTSVYTFLRAGVVKIEEFFDKLNPAQQVSHGILSKCESDCLTDFKYHDTRMPGMMYFRFVIAESFLNFLTTRAQPQLNLDKLEWVETFVNDYFQEHERGRIKYVKAVGKTTRMYNEDDYRPAKKAKNNSSSSSSSSSSSLSSNQQELHTAVREIQSLIGQAKLELVCEQHNWIRKHLIGKCLKGGMPGQGIDIACGYFHA